MRKAQLNSTKGKVFPIPRMTKINQQQRNCTRRDLLFSFKWFHHHNAVKLNSPESTPGLKKECERFDKSGWDWLVCANRRRTGAGLTGDARACNDECRTAARRRCGSCVDWRFNRASLSSSSTCSQQIRPALTVSQRFRKRRSNELVKRVVHLLSGKRRRGGKSEWLK